MNRIYLLSIALLALLITACEQAELSEPSTAESIDLFQKELLVEDESGENQVKLTFLSQHPIDARELENTEYRLVSIPIEELTKDLPTTKDDLIQDVETEQSSIDLANAITVEMEVIKQTANTALALQIERKPSMIESRDCGDSYYEPYWYTTRSTRRAYVKNFSRNPLSVEFYSTYTANPTTCTRSYPKGCVGWLRVSKTLYRNGAWYYYNCNLQVAALVTPDCSKHYHFQWLFWNVCGPL